MPPNHSHPCPLRLWPGPHAGATSVAGQELGTNTPSPSAPAFRDSSLRALRGTGPGAHSPRGRHCPAAEGLSAVPTLSPWAHPGAIGGTSRAVSLGSLRSGHCHRTHQRRPSEFSPEGQIPQPLQRLKVQPVLDPARLLPWALAAAPGAISSLYRGEPEAKRAGHTSWVGHRMRGLQEHGETCAPWVPRGSELEEAPQQWLLAPSLPRRLT